MNQNVTSNLVNILTQNIDEIAALWSQKIRANASFAPSFEWEASLVASTSRSLDGIVDLLSTGSTELLDTYLKDLSNACLQSGFESGEVIEALLLCKDVVLPFIYKQYTTDLETVMGVIADLDNALRWMAGRYSQIHSEAITHRMREQRKCVASMMKLGQHEAGEDVIMQVLREVAWGIIAAVDVDHCNIYSVADDQQVLIPLFGVGNRSLSLPVPDSPRGRPPELVVDVFLKEVLKRKQPLASYDAHQDSRINPVTFSETSRSVLVVPVVTNGRVVAMAVTGTLLERRIFNEEQLELVWNLARAASLVIENVQLHLARLAENASLQRVTSGLLQELDLNDVLRIVCTEALRLTGAQGSAVFTMTGSGCLKQLFSVGDKPTHECVPLEGSITERALREERVFIVNSPGSDERLFEPDTRVKNMLVAPLKINGSIIGALYAANKPQDFNEDDARIIGLFASQAVVAIENARLHEQGRYVAILEERERLAREIHDNVAQSLSILKLQSSYIHDLVKRGQVEQAQSALVEMRDTASEAHADAREAIFNLRHNASSTEEFLPSLRNYTERFQKTYDIDVRMSVHDDMFTSLPVPVGIQLTRIIQEALTNVRKHAHATTAWVELEKNGNNISLSMRDDGQGFDLDSLPEGDCECSGVGLQVMRERAESLGGNFEVTSPPGKGAHISVQIPLPVRR